MGAETPVSPLKATREKKSLGQRLRKCDMGTIKVAEEGQQQMERQQLK